MASTPLFLLQSNFKLFTFIVDNATSAFRGQFLIQYHKHLGRHPAAPRLTFGVALVQGSDLSQTAQAAAAVGCSRLTSCWSAGRTQDAGLVGELSAAVGMRSTALRA